MASKPNSNDLQLKLSLMDVNLVLEALGQLPYARVHEVIGSIQVQAQRQLQETAAETSEPPTRPRRTR